MAMLRRLWDFSRRVLGRYSEPMTMSTGTVAILPWLTFSQKVVSVGRIDFLRFEPHGGVPKQLKSIASNLTAIAGQFRHQGKAPLRKFTVVCVGDRDDPWNVRAEDGPDVFRAVNYLFLSAVAAHHLNDELAPPINSSYFALHQRYIGDGFVRQVSRRRDGETWGVRPGYKTLVIAPPQITSTNDVVIEERLLASLGRADHDGSPITARINLALPFFGLANTDSSEMASSVELVLAASAFEQLLGSSGSAYDLSEKFAKLFQPLGNVTAADAMAVRPGIVFNDGERYVEDRKTWFAHQMWIYELHKARSKSAHKGTLGSRTWGWSPLEHLVMANFSFPLAAKLLLAEGSFYQLTPAEESKCRAIDRLLKATDWPATDSHWQASSVWTGIVRRAEYEEEEEMARQDFIRTLSENRPKDDPSGS
jgi:hypothetical protein